MEIYLHQERKLGNFKDGVISPDNNYDLYCELRGYLKKAYSFLFTGGSIKGDRLYLSIDTRAGNVGAETCRRIKEAYGVKELVVNGVIFE